MEGSGVKSENQADPITVGEEGMSEGRSTGDGSDTAKGPVNYGSGVSSVEKEGGHFGGSLVEVGLIRTYVTDMEELGEWNRVFAGSRMPAPCSNEVRRKLEEQHLIFQLSTLQPSGLNVEFNNSR
eukprot:g40700.t1